MSRKVFLTTSVILALVAACMALVIASMKPAEAAFPGKNGDIAFNGNPIEVGNANFIYTINPDGTGLKRILDVGTTGLGEYTEEPTWSPRGEKIAVETSSEGEWDTDIFLANSDGSDAANLTKTPDYHESNPAFIPSGKEIIFCGAESRGNSSSIYSMPLDTEGGSIRPRKQLTNSSAGTWSDCFPSVSPDGKKIAFARSQNYLTSHIYVMRTGTPEGPDNQVENLTNSPSPYNSTPDWSPDGQKIVYQSGDKIWAMNNIWVMNANGSEKKNLGPGRDPAFSPDGEMIAFTYSGQLWKMRADGTQRTKISPNVDDRGEAWGLSEPSWQPLLPSNKAECNNSGYKEFGFENQGLCIEAVTAAR